MALKPDSLAQPRLRRSVVQQRAQDRIDAILSAAEDAIAAAGNDGLSIVDIATRAGITHTSIYHYFKSIDEVLVMLMWRHVSEYADEINKMLARSNTVLELIDAYARSKRLGWDKYRNTPVARGLWARARYLTTLRRVDDEYNAQRTDLMRARFEQLAPTADHGAIRTIVMLTMALTVPTFELAMTQSKPRQVQIVEEFIKMARTRLFAAAGLLDGDSAGSAAQSGDLRKPLRTRARGLSG